MEYQFLAAPTRGGRQRPAHKWLLALDEAAGAVPTRGQATRFGCLRRGHRVSPRPARRGATVAAVAVVA
ncbi:hypothetical protein BHM03_00032580 [Ensete ventricosum]|nr:hypothetical protein BHM03_00032580 [Ensete ventricosum]